MPISRRYGDVLQFRADLWRVPFSMCLGAVAFFLVTVLIDREASRGTLHLPGWLSVGGPDDARAILGAMLGAVSTVLALIFSVALLVLSMAVTNFGPRILYRFVSDGVTQATIGLFLASFVHTFLAFVVTRQQGDRQFVPQLTLMCGVALVMTSFIVLVIFSHRIAMSIQTQNVVAHIVADLDWALEQMTAGARQIAFIPQTPTARADRDAFMAGQEAEGGIVPAPRTGFIQEVRLSALVAAAERHDAGVRLLYRPGQFVMEGSALAQVRPAARLADLGAVVDQGVQIGRQRTLKQDLEFGIAQLVEIALRALSPAINDTFTGLTCVDWLGDELRAFASMPQDTGAATGRDGSIRLAWPPLQLTRLTGSAFNQIRQAATGNPAVSIRLLQVFARLAEQVEDAPFREALRQQVDAVWEAVSAEALVKSDRADVERAYRRVSDLLGPR
jgi:uncharacterized membrane protein